MMNNMQAVKDVKEGFKMSEVKMIPTRDAYGEEILALGREAKNIYVVDCDIGKLQNRPFSQELPEQHVNVGIAEQNACGVAAGLATVAKSPLSPPMPFSVPPV